MVSRLRRLVARSSEGHEAPFVVYVTQHAEPQDGIADRGLSQRGREQAAAFGRSMKAGDITVFVSSPAQASVETAETLVRAIGGEHVILEAFGEAAGNTERSGPTHADHYTHSRGGYDQDAADRFFEGLDLIHNRYASAGRVMVVADGERTLNAVRVVRSDGQIEAEVPGVFEEGIPPCGMTTFVRRGSGWDVEEIAALTIPEI